MDPEEYADAVERLEQAYVEGGMSADEYTRRRRELEQRASTQEPVPEQASPGSRCRPSRLRRLMTATGDPLTGAPLASWGRRAGGWFVDLLVYIVAFIVTFVLSLATEDPDTGEVSSMPLC